MSCKDFEQTLALYIYGELSGGERASFEDHLASCQHCRGALEESRRLEELLAGRSLPQPTPDLLVVCRQKLEDTLDREQLGWRALIRSWLPPAAAAHPARAMTAVTLVAFGFSLGWILRPRVGSVISPPVTNIAPGQLTGGDLGGARINSISQVAPDPETGQVRITLNAERRVTMEGSLDDPRIRQVLVYAVKSYSNPGIRLDTLNALRPGSNDPAVLGALVYALRRDPNAGVRLEALRALRKTPWNEGVEQALAAAAQKDANLGVRDEAINGLVEHALSAQDDSLVPTLRQLAAADSDRYVRIKSLTALRQMGQEP
jgi:Putative zinc-finger